MSRLLSERSTLVAPSPGADSRYMPLTDSSPWSVVSSRPVKTGGGATGATTQGITCRYSEVAPFDLVAVRLIYANWQNAFGSAEAPNYNGYRVRAAVHKAGTAAPDRATTDWGVPATFGGREFGYCPAGLLLATDPIPVSVKKSERWWHESYADVNLPAAPAVPTLTAAGSGSSLGTGTFYAVITYVYADGTESLPSPEGSVAVTAGQTVTITAPAASAGAVGWRGYVTGSPGSAGAVKYEDPTQPMAPIGTNITYSTGFTGSPLLRLARTAGNVGLPLGAGFLGGIGGTSLGETSFTGRDYTTPPVTMTGITGFGSNFGPIGVIGVAADGRLHRSVALLGDSIQAGTGDSGYGAALGGFVFRALANQTQQMPYDSTKTPSMGFLSLAQGGESAASYATTAGAMRRSMAAEYATTIVDNYGTNDTANGSAPLYASILTIFQRYQNRKKYLHTTIDPKTITSSDGWQTVAGQTITDTIAEGSRRAINNCLRDTTGAVTVTSETLFRSPTSASATSSTTFYSGGDSTAVKYLTAYPFQTGTEVVKINGTTQTVTTNYSYLFTVTISGVTYASGIQFTSAPANGATVTASYTKAASFPSLSGWTGTLDTAAAVEVDGTGTAALNGGFWHAANMTGSLTGTVTSASAAVLNDTTKSWTTDQWRGYSVIITADTTTPASVGQVIAIQSNTATQLKLAASWTTAPSSAATYQVFRPYVVDGTHASSYGHMLKAQAVDVTKF